MKELKDLRKELDKIDKDMAKLFEKRMKVIELVRVWKKENNYPIYDKTREDNMLEKNSAYIANKELLPCYDIFLKGVTGASKEYMRDKN